MRRGIYTIGAGYPTMHALIALYGVSLCVLMVVLAHSMPAESLAACVEPGSWNSTVLPE